MITLFTFDFQQSDWKRIFYLVSENFGGFVSYRAGPDSCRTSKLLHVLLINSLLQSMVVRTHAYRTYITVRLLWLC